MENKAEVAVVGLGEVGRPLLELMSRKYQTVGIDIPPVKPVGCVDILHICYPFQIEDFVGETVRYITLFRPALTIVNSTVAIGTTREIAQRAGAAVVNSPVRGKHAHMLDDLSLYTKFVGALNRSAGEQAAKLFESVGLRTKILSSPEATELAKLSETTYFGLMIAWDQEVERYCDNLGEDYHEVVSFYEEVKFFPPVQYFPGVIGGHCVLPNIEILSRTASSEILQAIRSSNRQKIAREERKHQTEAANKSGTIMTSVAN
jgi:UDP-N-acetyl-D-mannosaminuronate dehydrogenase